MKPIRVLLIAPSPRIVGGQSVQAGRLLEILNETPAALRVDFQPLNVQLPAWIEKVKYFRTLMGILAYCGSLVWRVPRYDILHVFSAATTSYTLWSLPALLVAKLFGKAFILNYRDGQAEEHLRDWRTAIPTIGLADVIVTPSYFLVDVFKRYGLTARSIFNVIDMSRFRYRPRHQLRPAFLHNRILEPLYNVECSLRAFQAVQQRYPDATLVVAHDGPSRPGLEAYAGQIGLRNCRFIGRVAHGSMPELYDGADLYLTSPNFDCMPGSLLECFASGLPVIATAAGGIPYIATHEKTALLVPAGDDQAMAASALRLLEDPELVARLTAAAREECRRYDPNPVREQWHDLYQELMAMRRK